MKLNRLLRRDIMKYVSYQKLSFTINSKKKKPQNSTNVITSCDTPSTSFIA